VNDWIAVEVIDRGHEALLELLFGGHTDVAQDGSGGEEAFDEVEPGAVLGSEGELKPASGLLGEPSSGLCASIGWTKPALPTALSPTYSRLWTST
jgi:hypothetical protein